MSKAEWLGLRWQFCDLTERQQTQLQLQRQEAALAQREKLAAMGSLLATVGHELNNPLAIALIEAEILEDALKGESWADHARKLTEATARCAQLVQNFLTLARQHPPARVPVQLNAVIAPALDLLRYSLQVDNVELCLQLADELPRLAKPFTARDVRRAVAEALQGWPSTPHARLTPMAPPDAQAPAP